MPDRYVIPSVYIGCRIIGIESFVANSCIVYIIIGGVSCLAVKRIVSYGSGIVAGCVGFQGAIAVSRIIVSCGIGSKCVSTGSSVIKSVNIGK